MILTAPDVSSVSHSLHHWELAEYIFEGLVIIACAGELVADLGRKCLTRAPRDRIERFSTILLVAALSIELICLVKTNELSGNVIGSLGEKAEEADRKAKKALDDSALAITQSGRALAIASAAELEADKLKTRFSDRTITDEQAESIVDSIRLYAGQEFTIVPYWDLKEPSALANRLFVVINRSGWKYVELKTRSYLFAGISGVEVWMHPAAPATTRQAADVLASALNKIGIKTKIMQQNPANPFDPKIRLNVGTKE